MKKRTIEENPKWTAAHFKRAKAAREVLPALFGDETAGEMLKPRGRPKSPHSRVAISLRVPPDVLARWKASGAGWQTRMADSLKRHAPRR
jgi:uncharacterized protein (DUF4415 family)